MKTRRLTAIRQVVDREPVHSQEELRQRLQTMGFDVTQGSSNARPMARIRPQEMVRAGAALRLRRPSRCRGLLASSYSASTSRSS
jgi:hypothetical protein